MSIKEYLADDDPNKWWRLSSGEHENLFDEAMEQVTALTEENARLQKEKHNYTLDYVIGLIETDPLYLEHFRPKLEELAALLSAHK